MRRERAYGSTVRYLRGLTEELEQRQADFDQIEDEMEEGYTLLQEQQSKVDADRLSAETLKEHLTQELKRANELHPALEKQLYITPNDIRNGSDMPKALTIRLLAPRVEWDDKEDKGLVTLMCSKDGMPEHQAFAMSMGYFDSIDETILEGVVKETAESINQQLWKIIKGRKQNG